MDKCVVCGEADQGKPLYKKLGSGEYNVEVIVALRDLELTSLPESAKADHYICWDCDETILQEYGRYLEYEEKRKVQENKNKEEKRIRKNEQQRKRRSLGGEKSSKPKHSVKPVPEDVYPTKLKQIEIQNQKTNDLHKGTHCVICDCTFEVANRGYYRHTLKKMVNDDMDVASVMEFLGLARRIAPEVKAKRFVCNNCFYTIRRNYKNKLAKGTSVESPADGKTSKKIKPIHRATPDEHAAEIAKLLPPALAECYKIMTSDNVCNASVNMNAKVNPDVKSRAEVNRVDAEGEDEEGLQISQDEHGNFVLDMKVESPSKDGNKINNSSRQPGDKVMVSKTHRKKKNVLLPKRNHHHLLENNGASSSHSISAVPDEVSTKVNAEGNKDGNVDPDEVANSRTCNICGRTFTGKPDPWWHTLSSSLSGLESVTVSMALQMLETSLANTNEQARLACQVCNLCFGMVSSGFRHQVVERIARQKNIDASQVNFSKIKVRMMRKEDLCGVDAKKIKNNVPVKDNHKTSSNDSNVSKLVKGKVVTHHATEQKKQRVNNVGLKKNLENNHVSRSSPKKNHGKYSGNKKTNRYGKTNDSSSSDEDFFDDSHLSNESPQYSVLSDMLERNKKKPTVNYKAPKGPRAKRTKGKFKHSQNEKKENVPTSVESGKGMLSNGNGKDIPNVCSVKEVLVVNSGMRPFDDEEGEEIDVEKLDEEKECYEVNDNCQFYFSLSKMQEAKVLLHDIKKSLPNEAFDGRSLFVRNQPDGRYQISFVPASLPSSAFQLLLNSMLPPNWSKCVKEIPEMEEEECSEPGVSGRCVVCAYFFQRPLFVWHNLREDIKPPSLQVPVRWVLASLSIAPVKLTSREKEEGRVCGTCFKSLTRQFEEFVRVKIGESCDMIPSQVVITDYVVTFNQETMNIEADPVDLTADEELEESSRIVSKVEFLLKSVNFDRLLDESYINPLSKEDFTTCLLLALNEFRVQIGVSSTKLMSWLMKLMPMEYHVKGLQPMESKVLMFIKSIVTTLDGSSRECFEKLGKTIPASLFITPKSSKSAKKTVVNPEIKTEIKEEHTDEQDREMEREVYWEDFLNPVNVDQLLEGKGKPLPRKHFNNGLLYGLWRLAADLKVGREVLGDWLQQVSPIPLEKEHVELLLNAPKPIHDHLLIHPEDMKKLDCVIIPEPPASSSAKGKTNPKQSEVKKSSKANADLETNRAGENGRVISHQTTNKRKSELPAHEKKCNKRAKYVVDPPSSSPSTASMHSPSPNGKSTCREEPTSRTVTPAKLKSNVPSPENAKGNSKKSVTLPNIDSDDSDASGKLQQLSVTKADSGISQKLTLTNDKHRTKSITEESQESNNNESLLIKEYQESLVTQSNGKDSAVEGEPGELAFKIKELEEQLQAVKRQNEELLKLNQKLELLEENEVQVKENEEVSPSKNSTLKSSHSKVQRELTDNKPNQALSLPGHTPKKKTLPVESKKKRLSLKRRPPRTQDQISKEIHSPSSSKNEMDQGSLSEVDELQDHSESNVPKDLIQSEMSELPVTPSGSLSTVGNGNEICMPESPSQEESTVLKLGTNLRTGDKCLKEIEKSEEILANDLGKDDELDLENSKNESFKEKEDDTLKREESAEKELSYKERGDSVENADGREGSHVTQVSITESLKTEQVPSQSEVVAHDKDVSESLEESSELSLELSSDSIASEFSKECETEDNSQNSDKVTEGRIDFSDVTEKGESLGKSESPVQCTEEENKDLTLESSKEILDSVKDCGEERPSPQTGNGHNSLENLEGNQSSLSCNSNGFGENETSSSSITSSTDSTNSVPQKEEQDTNSTDAGSPIDKNGMEGENVLENPRGNNDIEGIAEMEETVSSIEKRHDDKTTELGKSPVSAVENEQTHIESAITSHKEDCEVTVSRSEENEIDARKHISEDTVSSDNESNNGKGSSESSIKENELSDSSVTNDEKGNHLDQDSDGEMKGNSSCSDTNNKDCDLPTSVDDGEASTSKLETKVKVSKTPNKKIKVRGNSLFKQFSAVNKHNILSNKKKKDSECKTDTDCNGKKRKLEVTTQSDDKTDTPGKLASSKKPKPLFEDLMTYDT